ncbi:MAG: hypothetical protein ACM3PC_04320 [Deltaproteobacteria bacterium]
MNAPRTLEVSSRFTLAGKVVTAVFDAMVLIFVFSSPRPSLPPSCFFLAFALIIHAPVFRAKEIFAEDAGVRVRGLRSEALIPYDQIQEVRKSLRPGLVHVHLRCDTPFGRHIVFRAAWGFTRPAMDLLQSRMAGRS